MAPLPAPVAAGANAAGVALPAATVVTNTELMNLPTAFSIRRWEALVHEVVWTTGRAFGFQAFNINSQNKHQWVPASMFVASDHLTSLLVRNAYLREKAPQPDDHRFARAVWELHSAIFNGYETQWCKTVHLQPRPKQLQGLLVGDFASPAVVHCLTTELSLYLLMYSEAANLRHTPEALWFLYWALAHSPTMATLQAPGGAAAATLASTAHVTAAALNASHHGIVASARERRVAMRNALQEDLSSMRAQLGHDPAEASLDECADMLRFVRENMPPAPAALRLGAADRWLLADLVSHGDGGQFLDRIVSPLFLLLSYEQDARQGVAEEISFRLGYDDINESLSHRPTVSKLLNHLGVTKAQSTDANGAYAALTRLGCNTSVPEAAAVAAGASSATFDVQRAAAFYYEHIFVKTFRERRSWLAVFRAFYRVYCLHAVLLHLMFAQALAPNNLRIVSSAVITHAFCHFIERLSSALMTRNQANPLAAANAAAAAAATAALKSASKGDTEAPLATTTTDNAPATARTLRRLIKIEGAMTLAVFGVAEWCLVFCGITAIFALQFIEGAPLQALSHQYWMFIAGGYTAVHLAHGIITTRDGYAISLTAALRLPSLFCASSARPQATYWAAGSLKIGWGAFFLTVLFWAQVLACKIVFDFFVILKPLADPVRAILKVGWLACPTDNYQIAGFKLPIPCIGGDWLLLAVRCLPFFLVTFMDTHIFYQITLMTWGLLRGICYLDIGVVNDWDSLRREFHHAPGAWWHKCMSATGNANRLALVAARRAGINLDVLGVSHKRLVSDDGSASDDGYSITSGNSRASSSNGSISSWSPAWAAMDKKSATKNAMGKGAGGAGASMALMLQGRSDEHVAMWESFATAWDAIVCDLREADLLSDGERTNLEFVRLAAGGDGGVSDVAALAGGGDSAGGGVRPILLPAFFYAGQVQRVIDAGIATPSQTLVLAEVRSLFVFLGAQLGLLAQAQCTALLGATLCNQVVDLAHAASRQQMLQAAIKLLASLQGLAAPALSATDRRRRQAALVDGAAALAEVLACLGAEAEAAARVASGKAKGGRRGLGAAEAAAANALLAELAVMRMGILTDSSVVHACFRALQPEEREGESMSRTASAASLNNPEGSSSSEPLQSQQQRLVVADAGLLCRVVDVLHTMLTVRAAAAQPSGTEARRVLGFFMSSLNDRQLGATGAPPPLDESPSHTILTPLYEEDVLYPLDARGTAAQLQCKVAVPGAPSAEGGVHGVAGLTDLLTESEDRVSLMSYLRSVFPKDWENFKQRLGQQLGGRDLSAISEEDFVPGGELAPHHLRLQLWASFRGQLLARTVRGMMAHDKALRLTARMEHPCPPGVTRSEYEAWVEELVSDKFNYVVSSQVYGTNRHSKEPRKRWLAEGIDILLEEFPRLAVAFIDSGPATPFGLNCYSVLIRSRRDATGDAGAALMLYGGEPNTTRVEEMYRVRLPVNRFTGRGPIIGEGKPENQNHAVIFCFGEALQTIDMNQDNHVCEALKMRNLLTELRPQYRNPRAPTLARAPLDGSALTTPPLLAASEFHRTLQSRRCAESPVALVGFREWIFSDKSGAMGSFAASAELAFGTIVQRTMSYPASVRLHYGHPDVFNKLHVMTRGGVSKATRQLHVSEDIFGGFNHILRGGRIKYREYLSVGKGRDMGFDTINAFEIKISGGNGEVVISRDLWRIATRMDFFRLLHFYHSGCGYYINSYITMATVYLQLFALLFFALAQSSSVIVAIVNKKHPDLIAKYTIDDTIKVTQVLQLGMLSILPYLAELLLEVGPIRAARTAAWQILSGSFGFFVFKQQTTAHYFADDMIYGGASYVSTGRGFSITTSHFLKIFANYARSHIYLGFELAFMAIVFAIVQDCNSCSYPGMTWGAWLVAASLIFAPFWFNPLTFDTAKVARDLTAWSAWLGGEADPSSGITWHAWNRKQLEKVRNDRGNQTDHGGNTIQNLLFQCTPPVLLALATVSRLDISPAIALPLTILGSSWIIFVVASILLWLTTWATASLATRWRNAAKQHTWRIFAYSMVLLLIGLVAAYFAAFSKVYKGPSFPNIVLFLYANLNLLIAGHRAATHLCTGSPRSRAFVDAGFHAIDTAVGYLLLALVGLLSFFAFVGKMQATLLFSSSFARSVRRGGIVRTIGLQKADASRPRAIAEEEEATSNAAGGNSSNSSNSALLSKAKLPAKKKRDSLMAPVSADPMDEAADAASNQVMPAWANLRAAPMQGYTTLASPLRIRAPNTSGSSGNGNGNNSNNV